MSHPQAAKLMKVADKIALGTMPTDRDIDTLHRAAAELDRLHALTAWQPIETAPKDGTNIRAYGTRHGSWGYSEDELVSIDAAWHGTGRRWIDVRDQAFIQRRFTPTHWMPLPTPPERTT